MIENRAGNNSTANGDTMSTTLYIADLHLQSSTPKLTELAFELLNTLECEHLFILGDLFEYWIGDDSIDHTAEAVSQKLKTLHKRGTEIKVMHGNRDFLLGDSYVSGFGGTLVSEDTIKLDIAGKPTLLMHGDTLCTDDKQYQFYRRMVRNRDWQKDFLAKSVSEREATARMIRSTSKASGSRAHKNSIADINADTLLQTVDSHQVERVIHGHTHRPALHTTTADQKFERLVLGDWHTDHAVIAVSDAENCELVKWDGSTLTSLA